MRTWLTICTAAAVLTVGCTKPSPPAAGSGPTIPPAVAPQTTDLTITLLGGLVFIASEKDHALTFGPMKNDDAPHVMSITSAAETTTETSLPQVTADSYSLDGVVASLRADGLPQTGLPTLPAATPTVQGPGNDWNNLYLLPDLAAIAGEATGRSFALHKDWQKMLASRLTFTGGELTVAAPPEDVVQQATWEFTVKSAQNGQHIVRTQFMSNKVVFTAKLTSPVATLVGADGRVLLTLKPATPGGSIAATITARLDPKHPAPANIKPHEPLPHFARFYDILTPDLKASERPIPLYTPTVVKAPETNLIFGGYCFDLFIHDKS